MTNMSSSDILDRSLFVSKAFLKNCLVFDGTNEYVIMNNILNFERTDTFSVSAWFKTGTQKWEAVIAKGISSGTYRGWRLVTTNNPDSPYKRMRLDLINTATTNHLAVGTSIEVVDNKWHHIVATYDGSSTPSGVKLYLDGVLDSSPVTYFNTLSSSITSTASLSIGSIEGANFFWNGSIADVSVWNKVLSGSEVTTVYNMGVPKNVAGSSGLVGYWRLRDMF
jgi:hypothetical protein